MRLKKFGNIDPIEQHTSFKQFNRWRQERISKARRKDYSYTIPSAKPDIEYLENNRKFPSITWIGHSTFLIQIGGMNIITDPVWASQMAFHKRLSPPGIAIDDVPPIDVVLISHSHYDHLSIQTLRRLIGPRLLIVPAGLGAKLRKKGFINVRELQWWESTSLHGIRLTFVPSQHSTRRNPWDTNSSHWGGFIIEQSASRSGKLVGHDGNRLKLHSEARQAEVLEQPIPPAQSNDKHPYVAESPTIYFAGDSGYFQGFKEIGRRFPIDVALLPIGAYEPEWFMGPQHTTPEQALQAFVDTRATWFVPMHYGTFRLADDTPLEALDRLEADRANRSIEQERIVKLPLGQTWKLAHK